MSDSNNNDQERTLRTASGKPFYEYEDTQTVGPRGPALLQDYILHEDMAHFNRERIPERVVHAKGGGAFGTFTVTNDITEYTKADIFSEVGKETRMLARFSRVAGERGSADAERDPRGFALKFYTKEGNWDLVGNNTPVFFVKDAKKFSDFIHSQKRHPKTNCRSKTMMWDFWSHNPESLHQVIILMSDRGIPRSYRFMNGYGSHTFSLINEEGTRTWVKFHLKTEQGIENLTPEEAAEVRKGDPDHSQRDLVETIENGDYPTWTLKIQIMNEKEALDFEYNPFDLTKVWPHGDYPMIEVGKMELNEVPDNYFATIEQAAFAPAHVVPGISYSPDKMLQGRILSYPDTHRHRLGANYEQIPVNRCPYMNNKKHNYERDGFMTVDDNGGSSMNYHPNSFDNIKKDERAKQQGRELDSSLADWFDRNKDDDDHYTQPGNLYRDVMDDTAKDHLVHNTVLHMGEVAGEKRDEIINRQLCHWFRADKELGSRIAEGLGVEIDESMVE